jgi:hypothetical protein
MMHAYVGLWMKCERVHRIKNGIVLVVSPRSYMYIVLSLKF